MSPKRTFQISGLQRRPSTRAPMPSTGSKFQKLSTSARDWESIHSTDGSTASRANTARNRAALGWSAAPGAIEPSVTSTSGGPLRPMSGSSSSARTITAGASAPPPLWPTTMTSSASFARTAAMTRCAQASIGASKQVASPRANSQR